MELPSFPGLVDITRLIFISKQLSLHSTIDRILIILPPPMHAFELIGLAHQGPILIENLLEPLLNWWDNTRKSLAAVEALLRIKLPSSKQLRLTDKWRQNLELLQTATLDRKKHHFYLAFDGEGHSKTSLTKRLGFSGIHAVIPSHLIVSDTDNKLLQILEEQFDQDMMWVGSEANFLEVAHM